jgi:F0F1-type ATP synthase delta subunit
MEKQFKNLADKIITNDELGFVLQEINQLQKKISERTEKDLTEKLQKTSNEKLKYFITQWEKQNLIPENNEGQSVFLEELKQYLQKIPQIRIQVARTLPDSFLEQISSWLKNNTKEKLILNIVFNPKIVGGAIIEYKGEYRNYSLAKNINKIIEKNEL